MATLAQQISEACMLMRRAVDRMNDALASAIQRRRERRRAEEVEYALQLAEQEEIQAALSNGNWRRVDEITAGQDRRRQARMPVLINGMVRHPGDSWEERDADGVLRVYTLNDRHQAITPQLSPNDEGPTAPPEQTVLRHYSSDSGVRLNDVVIPDPAPRLTIRYLTPGQYSWRFDVQEFWHFLRREGVSDRDLGIPLRNTRNYGIVCHDRLQFHLVEMLARQIGMQQLQLIASVPNLELEVYEVLRSMEYTLTMRSTDGENLQRAVDGQPLLSTLSDPRATEVRTLTTLFPRDLIRESGRRQESTTHRQTEHQPLTVALPQPIHDANSPRRIKLKRDQANVPHDEHQGDQDSVYRGVAPRRKRAKRNGR